MALDKEDLQYLKAIFVQREDCNKTVSAETEKINELTVLFAKSNTKLSILIGILATIAAPILTLCIKFLFEK